MWVTLSNMFWAQCQKLGAWGKGAVTPPIISESFWMIAELLCNKAARLFKQSFGQIKNFCLLQLWRHGYFTKNQNSCVLYDYIVLHLPFLTYYQVFRASHCVHINHIPCDVSTSFSQLRFPIYIVIACANNKSN
jgi:hypothetical protein